jgi:hypothetical protein
MSKVRFSHHGREREDDSFYWRVEAPDMVALLDAARSSASPTEKLDELAAESQRLGLYDPQPGGPT